MMENVFGTNTHPASAADAQARARGHRPGLLRRSQRRPAHRFRQVPRLARPASGCPELAPRPQGQGPRLRPGHSRCARLLRAAWRRTPAPGASRRSRAITSTGRRSKAVAMSHAPGPGGRRRYIAFKTALHPRARRPDATSWKFEKMTNQPRAIPPRHLWISWRAALRSRFRQRRAGHMGGRYMHGIPGLPQNPAEDRAGETELAASARQFFLEYARSTTSGVTPSTVLPLHLQTPAGAAIRCSRAITGPGLSRPGLAHHEGQELYFISGLPRPAPRCFATSSPEPAVSRHLRLPASWTSCHWSPPMEPGGQFKATPNENGKVRVLGHPEASTTAARHPAGHHR